MPIPLYQNYYLEQKATHQRLISTKDTGEETRCELCERGEEDLQHFMLEYMTLEEKRDQEIMIKHWSPDKEEMIGNIIFDIEEIGKVKNMLVKMWHKRKTEIKKKENILRQLRENIQQRRNERLNNRREEQNKDPGENPTE